MDFGKDFLIPILTIIIISLTPFSILVEVDNFQDYSQRGYIVFAKSIKVKSFLEKWVKSGKVLKIWNDPPYYFVPKDSKHILDKLKFFPQNELKVYPNKIYGLAIVDRKEISSTVYEISKKIGAPTFWKHGYNGSSVKVALVDTGIDLDHPDIKGKVLYSRSFVYKKFGYKVDEPSVYDGNGHGTFLAGIIAGSGANDSIKGLGVAFGAYLINARVFPSGKVTFATTAALIAALNWLRYGEDGIPNSGDEPDIINLSISGLPGEDMPLINTINKLASEGFVVIVAAGNRGEGGALSSSITSPATSPFVISVGAVDVNLSKILDFSSIGPTIDGFVKPDLVAPGSAISLKIGGGYTEKVGTSTSAAFVSGGVALIIDYLKRKGLYSRNTSNGLVKILLYEGSKRISGYGVLWQGCGVIDLNKIYYVLESGYFKKWVVLPKSFPLGYLVNKTFYPYGEKIFVGEEYVLPIEIVSSSTINLEVYVNNDFSGIGLELLNKSLSIKPTTNIVYVKIFANGKESGNFNISIVFVDEDGSTESVYIWGEVCHSDKRFILVLSYTDRYLNGKYINFRELRLFLEEINVSLIEIYNISQSFISSLSAVRDILVLVNPALRVWEYDIFGELIRSYYLNIPKNIIFAFQKFVSDGGTIIILSAQPTISNISNLNELLEPYMVKISNYTLGTYDYPVKVYADKESIFTLNVSVSYHYGATIERVGKYISAIFKHYDIPTAVAYLGKSGAVFVFGSPNYFQNKVFLNMYNSNTSSSIKMLIKNILSFGDFGKRINVGLEDKNVVRGESFSMRISIPKNKWNGSLTIKTNDILGEEVHFLNKHGEFFKLNITTRVAGLLEIGIIYRFFGRELLKGITMYVNPKNFEGPKIYCKQNNTIYGVKPDNRYTIVIEIYDRDGLLPVRFQKIDSSLKGQIILHEYNETYETINISYSGILILSNLNMQRSPTLTLILSIRAVDLDLNDVQSQIFVYFQRESKAIGYRGGLEIVVSVAMISVIAFITVYLIYIEKKGKKKTQTL